MAVPSLNNQNSPQTPPPDQKQSDGEEAKQKAKTETKPDGSSDKESHSTDAPPPQPQTPFGRLHRFLLGNPIPTREADASRLPKVLALPVFSSDAISSVAYATQEILLALGAAGLAVAANRAAYTHYT